MDETRKRLDAENQEFRRKAALGWLLGCLSGMYSMHMCRQANRLVMDCTSFSVTLHPFGIRKSEIGGPLQSESHGVEGEPHSLNTNSC
jgi:hypothetical protein